MSVKRIVQGFGITIPVRVIEKLEGEPDGCKDITGVTEIAACVQSLVLNIGNGGTIVTSAPRGEFNVLISAAQATALTLGKDTLIGQIEIGTTQQPIPFTIAINVVVENCP